MIPPSLFKDYSSRSQQQPYGDTSHSCNNENGYDGTMYNHVQ